MLNGTIIPKDVELNPIYLDHNATTPVDPEVIEVMLPWLREHFGNPSSSHVYGRRSHTAVESARELVSKLLGCMPDEVYFTSGGTEANNLAIFGTTEAAGKVRTRIVTSQVEHPAAARPCERLEQRGWTIAKLPVDSEGLVSPDDFRKRIDETTALVTVMHANNETGTIMPIRRLTDIAHEKGALVHIDAAQSVGKIPVRVDDLGEDLLSLLGHKVYAPKGIGVLYVRRGTPIKPVLLGAGHERGLRPGTENVPHIVGLGKACEIAADRLEEDALRIALLRDRLWDRLRAGIPEIRLNGHTTERLPNTLNVSFPGLRGSALLEAASMVAAPTGSACHEGGRLLQRSCSPWGRIRMPHWVLSGCLSGGTIEADVREAADLLISAWKTVSQGT